jgi:putative transposase
MSCGKKRSRSFPSPSGTPIKCIKENRAEGKNRCPTDKYLRVFSTFCVPGASGKPFPKSVSVAPVPFTNTFWSGREEAFSSLSGKPDSRNMMTSSELTGNGPVLTVLRSKRPWLGKRWEITPPTGEKKGTKRHLLTDGRGSPISIVVTGANRPDSPQTGPVLERVIVPLPYGITPKVGGDKGYSGEPARAAALKYGFISYLMQCGTTYQKGFVPRRWMVERTHSWLNRFRKLLVRYEKRAYSYEGLLHFACAIICFRMAFIR